MSLVLLEGESMYIYGVSSLPEARSMYIYVVSALLEAEYIHIYVMSALLVMYTSYFVLRTPYFVLRTLYFVLLLWSWGCDSNPEDVLRDVLDCIHTQGIMAHSYSFIFIIL